MPKPTAANLADARAKLKAIDKRHGRYMDEMLADFEARLDSIIEKATAIVTSAVLKKVTVNDAGTVVRNAKTLGAIGDLDRQFVAAMKGAGFDNLTSAFVLSFSDQLPLMTETLDVISEAMQRPLTSGAILNDSDQALLANQQRLTLAGMRDVVANVGLAAKRRALAQVNGLTPTEFSGLLSKTFDISSGQAEGLAATGMATFYRMATERALAPVEKETPLKYAYDGPHDSLNRPFCDELKTQGGAGRTWTRAEIDAMDNGQIPNVFLSCGGYRCRHQWRVALAEDAIAHHQVAQKVAGRELLGDKDVKIFQRGSVDKNLYTFRAGSEAKLTKMRDGGINYAFAAKNAPFGAGFYASNGAAQASASNLHQVAFHVTNPLIGDWAKVKDEIGLIDEGLAPELTGSARARALRRALLRRGYDSVIAIRPNGTRVIVALKKGTAALVSPEVGS